MRLFEILILLALLAALLAPLLYRRKQGRWSYWLALLPLLLLIPHLLLEGARWQMAPAYLLVALVALWGFWRLRRPANPAGSRWRLLLYLTPVLLFYLLAVALPVVFPIPEIASPSGPYPVGTRSYHLVDLEREEIYTDDPGDRREVMVQFWYPAAASSGAAQAPYIERLDVAGPAIARRLGLPSFLLSHINLVDNPAYLNADVAEGGPFPLLIFSHGLRGLRGQNTILMEELASHGYVVASIDHTYGNVLTVFPDGRVAFYDDARVFPEEMEFLEAGARLVDVWVADIGFLLGQLNRWNSDASHPLAGQVDLGQIGTLGHSTGGAAALEACAYYAGCQGVVGLDPWIQPVSQELIRAGYQQPLLILRAPEWLGPENRSAGMELYNRHTGEKYLLTIAGTEHFDFTDLPLLSPLTPLLGLSGEIQSKRALEIINSYTLAFFEQTVKGQTSPLLEAPAAAFPEVQSQE